MPIYELVIRPDDGKPGVTPYDTEDELREAFRYALNSHKAFTLPASGGKFAEPGRFTAEMRIDGKVVEYGRPH